MLSHTTAPDTLATRYQHHRANHLLLVYKAQDAGNIIDRERLAVIHELESKIRQHPNFLHHCHSSQGRDSEGRPTCALPDSFINFIYPSFAAGSDPNTDGLADGTVIFNGLGPEMVSDVEQAVKLLLMAGRGGFFDQTVS